MLTGHSMVYFGDRWDGVLRNRQQLMSIFAQHNKVLFVERGNSLQTTLTLFRQRQLTLAEVYRPSLRKISENLFVFREPIWAPSSERFALGQLSGLTRQLVLRNVLRHLKIAAPIVWFYHPNWLDSVSSVPSACLRLYHVVDEYTSFQDKTAVMRQHIAAAEKKLMAQVDAVVVVSNKLYEAKCALHPNTYMIPNGVNYQAYSSALSDPSLPDDLARIPSPRLGYSGLIGDKLDLDMLKDLAQAKPDWSFVFLGPVNAGQKLETWHSLQTLPNVYYLGAVAWSQVPHYVKGFDVGLMPYVQNRNSETISPLKLYDYLAAGLPVVSMDIPPAREFGLYVHLAARPQDFSQAVQAALADRTPERHQARRSIAAQHTWESRVEQLSLLIQTQLTAKVQTNGVPKNL